MNDKEERLNDVLWAIEKMADARGVTKEEIGKYLLLKHVDSSQLDEALKDLIKSEFIFECIPDFEALPKTPKRYKLWVKDENN